MMMTTESEIATEQTGDVAEANASTPYYDDYGDDYYPHRPLPLTIEVFFPCGSTFQTAAQWCAGRDEGERVFKSGFHAHAYEHATRWDETLLQEVAI